MPSDSESLRSNSSGDDSDFDEEKEYERLQQEFGEEDDPDTDGTDDEGTTTVELSSAKAKKSEKKPKAADPPVTSPFVKIKDLPLGSSVKVLNRRGGQSMILAEASAQINQGECTTCVTGPAGLKAENRSVIDPGAKCQYVIVHPEDKPKERHFALVVLNSASSVLGLAQFKVHVLKANEDRARLRTALQKLGKTLTPAMYAVYVEATRTGNSKELQAKGWPRKELPMPYVSWDSVAEKLKGRSKPAQARLPGVEPRRPSKPKRKPEPETAETPVKKVKVDPPKPEPKPATPKEPEFTVSFTGSKADIAAIMRSAFTPAAPQ